MSEPFIGQIILFAGNYAPKGWALCQGQILSISQNQALFSILGTTYGGNGQTTFGLPDLRGRFPIGTGQGPGLTNRDLGELAGSERLTASQLPAHTHQLNGTVSAATSGDPTGKLLANSRASTYGTGSPVALSASSISAGGSASPSETMPPYQGLNYIIALEGIYPSRN
ncbi:phage tail protein [Cylindrospermum sp. FACHB-282]|uniref:phage tail protein n=1 Tax=Cylindrospermum sp. FACHB-282 TaxID=2692794 RepID=UPI0016860DF7|nr:tail fiber protein [Cylindrospermum sp. FACHB-282]MBD2386866.1 phage tail protein [Cylindrospermum sp. FACHB-282]